MTLIAKLHRSYMRRAGHQALKSHFADPAMPLDLPPVRIGATQSPLGQWDIRIRRDGGGFQIEIPETARSRSARSSILQRMAAYLYWFTQAGPEVSEITANTSDGDRMGLGQFAFSGRPGRVALLPDYYFFRDRGYLKQRRMAEKGAVRWADRSEEIVWRGGNTGQGLLDPDPAMADNPLLNQRVRLALKAPEAGIDMRFVSAIDGAGAYERAGLIGERQPAETWLGRKYAVDVDGFSNAWDNFFHRLLFGCCVLKVESQGGFRQWYYDRLRPFEHFVPVRADLSDLTEQVAWMRDNPQDAEQIARNGQAVARAMTFEAESRWAGREIDRVCRGAG